MTDVCLILEATYPYVSGGVSTWIHQLVSAMTDIRFSILYISAAPNLRREYKYAVPPNVVDIHDLYLQEMDFNEPLSPARRRRSAIAELTSVHESLFRGDWGSFQRMLPYFQDRRSRLSTSDIFGSQESWDALTHFYRQHADGISFVDFFWTWRSMYVPVMNTLRAEIPKARLYHTVSTGYAGLIAAMARTMHDKRMLLTEHGIYTHERFLEIASATWIQTPDRNRLRIEKELPFFKKLWYGLFDSMGRVAYKHSDRIVTLYEGNRTREIVAGAEPAKISVIPNGIDLDRFQGIKAKGRGAGAPTVAFIGRVVPIKDVKTFIQACRIVSAKVPDAEFLIAGPEDEEPEYALECRQLSESLGLQERLRFMGPMDSKDCYEAADVVVLTSLSEAQPYVALEANAVGLPVVATDVGACREMLEGRLPEDRQIGPSGLLTAVSSPEETAEAIIKVLKDEVFWRRLSEAGRERTFRFYDQNDLLGQYLNLYEQNMS